MAKHRSLGAQAVILHADIADSNGSPGQITQ